MQVRLGPPFTLCFLLLASMLAATGPTAAAEAGPSPHALAGGGVLDRIAGAVEGAESSHGADPQMWRSDPDGPQGPMQVSAAAATDVGGGDRFDDMQNRALGRAYLAQMYRRYGSWADAVAAYNWGPTRVTTWISGGRREEQFPAGVARYRARVLGASGLSADGGGPFNVRLARLEMLRLEARREFLDRRRRGRGPDEVELLYADIMRATDPAAR
jgi:hypothetical protein